MILLSAEVTIILFAVILIYIIVSAIEEARAINAPGTIIHPTATKYHIPELIFFVYFLGVFIRFLVAALYIFFGTLMYMI